MASLRGRLHVQQPCGVCVHGRSRARSCGPLPSLNSPRVYPMASRWTPRGTPFKGLKGISRGYLVRSSVDSCPFGRADVAEMRTGRPRRGHSGSLFDFWARFDSCPDLAVVAVANDAPAQPQAPQAAHWRRSSPGEKRAASTASLARVQPPQPKAKGRLRKATPSPSPLGGD